MLLLARCVPHSPRKESPGTEGGREVDRVGKRSPGGSGRAEGDRGKETPPRPRPRAAGAGAGRGSSGPAVAGVCSVAAAANLPESGLRAGANGAPS